VYNAAFNCTNDMIPTALVNLVSMFDGTMQSAHIIIAIYILAIEIIIIRGNYRIIIFLQYENSHLSNNPKILVSSLINTKVGINKNINK